MMTHETLHKAISTLQSTVNELLAEVKALRAKEPIYEVLINSKELRKRLQISKPTLIDMRNKGRIPYLVVNGQYRYSWKSVQAKLHKTNAFPYEY